MWECATEIGEFTFCNFPKIYLQRIKKAIDNNEVVWEGVNSGYLTIGRFRWLDMIFKIEEYHDVVCSIELISGTFPEDMIFEVMK